MYLCVKGDNVKISTVVKNFGQLRLVREKKNSKDCRLPFWGKREGYIHQ